MAANTLRVVLMTLSLLVLSLAGWSAEQPQFIGEIQYGYFEGEWSVLPDFNKLNAVKTGELDKFDLSVATREKNFAIRFSGLLQIPVDGLYLFTVKSGDLCRLYVGDELVMENDGMQGRRPKQLETLFPLQAGKHPVRLEYLHRERPKVLNVSCEGPELYKVDRKQWLYIGWENDHPKSLTFMGGTMLPGRGPSIQYTVEVDGKSYHPNEFSADRRSKIKWYLADGYLPSPVSEWQAENISVKIQHFANRILDDRATAVYTRVSLTNRGNSDEEVRLNINAGPEREVCLTDKPVTNNNFFSTYETMVPAGKTSSLDFAAAATGMASVNELRSAGSFDENYNDVATYYNSRIARLTRPVTLPNSKLVELYKSAQIVMWESVVKVENGDLEMRGSGGNAAGSYQYDRTFSHDVPNMVAQFIREGDFELAKGIMESSYYQKLGRELEQDYLDAIPKYIIPYALYLQFTGDIDYFTEKVKEKIRTAAHSIHDYRNFEDDNGHHGIMQKSNTLDNKSDYLIVDNFAALHGLAAYKFICQYFDERTEADWADDEMNDLNKCLNEALDHTLARRRVDWYMSAFDDDSYFWTRGYDGNWLGTSLMMSTFPWNASLQGFDLGGTWREAFDRTIENAINLRNNSPYSIPKRSWGAWWGHEYGACYNAGMGLQTLFSDKHRALAIANLEFLVDNQSAPYQWGESFDRGMNENDWTRPATDYETWGLGFDKQALLESCISVKTDGQVIIGRGVPVHWSKPGDIIEWKDVRINNNLKMSFRMEFGEKQVVLSLSGDHPQRDIIFDLPVFEDGIVRVIIDGGDVTDSLKSSGQVMISPGNANVEVEFKTKPK